MLDRATSAALERPRLTNVGLPTRSAVVLGAHFCGQASVSAELAAGGAVPESPFKPASLCGLVAPTPCMAGAGLGMPCAMLLVEEGCAAGLVDTGKETKAWRRHTT